MGLSVEVSWVSHSVFCRLPFKVFSKNIGTAKGAKFGAFVYLIPSRSLGLHVEMCCCYRPAESDIIEKVRPTC